MAKESLKSGKFGSMASWREFYFPKEVSGEKLDELSQSSEELGMALANDTIDRHIKKSRPRR